MTSIARIKSKSSRNKRPATHAEPGAPYGATILYAEAGRRLAKLYRDPDAPPIDYDAGALFQAREIECSTFREFVDALAELPADACIIRGGVVEGARADVAEGLAVQRLAHNRDDCLAAFEERPRSWIVLDADHTTAPFDPEDIAGSVDAWRATLPPEIRGARSAFFLSASSHRSPTVRGKLVVALDAPIDNATAAAYASAHGFDGSVCRTVQPNYFAAPVFEGCADPLAGKRAPLVFEGAPARLPEVPASATRKPSPRAIVPADVPADASDPLVPLLWAEYTAGGRHELVRALAGWMAKNNAPDERIAAVVSALPSDRVPARVRTALETAAQARRDENTAGWDALKARVGAEHAPALETALGGCTWSPWWEAFTARRESRLARVEAAPIVPANDATSWATVPADPLVLDTTREGTPRPTIANTLAVLGHVFGERVRYDEMRGRIVCAGIDPCLGRFPDGLWTDVHTINLVAMCERDALRITTKIANEAIKSHARAHAFNPLRDWLVQAAARWDGRPRVDTALATYWGAEDTPATRATSRVFLLSLAARGIEPGCKVDTCPIFIGAQGIYKSTALSVLAGGPDLFSDSPLPIGDKEALQNIRGKWLWEIGEHVSLTRRDANATKAFLSASHDTFRASYGHFTEDVPRTCVFVSTSNDTEVLRDTTGNRRLMPVRVARIDVAGIERDREQLLGEAAHRVAVLDENWWPSRDEERALAEVAAEHIEHDAWEDVIDAWLERRDADGKGPFTLPEVFDPFSGAIPMPAERVDMKAQKRAAAALRALGYERRRAWGRSANRARWVWEPAGA